ncbi:MAG TPA: hypothetical protein PKD09_09305 [Aggregatilinea sp.]|uniref:hypothetical protein n=1 Tax=Aggregatilinea sp. TaxID=2806333 RepID=UPI002CEF6D78|nr:hypothetical protein [Aggregatilinea sp.]HML21833.1 hypothetical protein [Aggregatilinea sp.]
MDEFTRDVFKAVYDELADEDKAITPDILIEKAEALYQEYSILTYLQSWTVQTLINVPQWKLIKIADRVTGLLGWVDAIEAGDDDPIWICEVVASGLAQLRWHNRLDRGLAPRLKYTESDVQTFFTEVTPLEQLALF